MLVALYVPGDTTVAVPAVVASDSLPRVGMTCAAPALVPVNIGVLTSADPSRGGSSFMASASMASGDNVETLMRLLPRGRLDVGDRTNAESSCMSNGGTVFSGVAGCMSRGAPLGVPSGKRPPSSLGATTIAGGCCESLDITAARAADAAVGSGTLAEVPVSDAASAKAFATEADFAPAAAAFDMAAEAAAAPAATADALALTLAAADEATSDPLAVGARAGVEGAAGDCPCPCFEDGVSGACVKGQVVN